MTELKGAETEQQDPLEDWASAWVERQVAVLGGFEESAAQASHQDEECVWWMGVERQAGRYLRRFQAAADGGPGKAHAVSLPYSEIEAARDRAWAALARFDGGVCARAKSRLGLRLAVVGKGGIGKSTVASTVARLLARRGRTVVLADLDSNPGNNLGLAASHTESGLPAEVLESHQGAAYGWQLAHGVRPRDVIERFAAPAPDNVRYLGLGKVNAATGNESVKQSTVAGLQILLGFDEPTWDIVADIEAGTSKPFLGYHSFADTAAIVVGPTWRSALTARRLQAVITDLPTTVVCNRLGDQDAPANLRVAATVPFDPCLWEADRLGQDPLARCPDSPVATALEGFVETLLAGNR